MQGEDVEVGAAPERENVDISSLRLQTYSAPLATVVRNLNGYMESVIVDIHEIAGDEDAYRVICGNVERSSCIKGRFLKAEVEKKRKGAVAAAGDDLATFLARSVNVVESAEDGGAMEIVLP